MRETPSAAHSLARHILALEAHGNRSDPPPDAASAAQAAVVVFTKLRDYLVKLVGVGGFEALLSRAYALSRNDVPWLYHVRVDANARLQGFETSASGLRAEEVESGSCIILAHLLGVLMVFVGEDLTVRLLRDIWPDIPAEAAGEMGREDQAGGTGREAGREESGA